MVQIAVRVESRQIDDEAAIEGKKDGFCRDGSDVRSVVFEEVS